MARKDEILTFLQQEFPQYNDDIESVGDKKATIRHHTHNGDLRPGGTVSGPTLFMVADTALYVAILGEIGIVPLAVTTNMNINFLRRPAPDRDVIAKCNLIKVGQKLIVGEVSLYSDGDDTPIAHAVGTYAVPPSR